MASRSLPWLTITLGVGILLIINVFTSAGWTSDEDDYLAGYTGADAELIGSDACLMCHSNLNPGNLFTHVAYIDGDPANEYYGYGCEQCHGPGGSHYGNTTAIINPSKLSGDQLVEQCTRCHESLRTFDRDEFFLSTHYENDILCLSCHSGHSANDAFLVNEDAMELCYTCHSEKRAQFNMRSHHPVDEGQLGCMDCHNPMSGQFDGQLKAERDDLCFTCHMDKKGPFMFNHEISLSAGANGCLTCHFPHGSNSDNLLQLPSNRLCLQCHTDRTPDSGHFSGACYTSGCHSQIHGSNQNPLFFN